MEFIKFISKLLLSYKWEIIINKNTITFDGSSIHIKKSTEDKYFDLSDPDLLDNVNNYIAKKEDFVIIRYNVDCYKAISIHKLRSIMEDENLEDKISEMKKYWKPFKTSCDNSDLFLDETNWGDFVMDWQDHEQFILES